MADKKVLFIAFAIEDERQRDFLKGQSLHPRKPFEFIDMSVKEPYDSDSSDYIKRSIREKIDRSSVTLVYLSDKAASSKWVNWEIEESLKRGKGVVGVYKGNTAAIVSIEGQTVTYGASLELSSSSDFVLNGETVNLANIAKAIHVNVLGPAPTFEQIGAGTLISIPLGGSFTATANRQSK